MKRCAKIKIRFSIMNSTYKFPGNACCLRNAFISSLIFLDYISSSFDSSDVFWFCTCSLHYILHACQVWRHSSTFYATISFKKWISIYWETLTCITLCLNNPTLTTRRLYCLIFSTSEVCRNKSNMWTWLAHNQKISFFTLCITYFLWHARKTHGCCIRTWR